MADEQKPPVKKLPPLKPIPENELIDHRHKMRLASWMSELHIAAVKRGKQESK